MARNLIIDDSEDINKEDKLKREKIYPWIGSKTQAPSIPNRFGTKIYLKKKLGKHAGMSGSTSSDNAVVGSRIGLKVEDDIGLKSLAYYYEMAKLGKTSIVLPK
jgi:hypothetical protein